MQILLSLQSVKPFLFLLLLSEYVSSMSTATSHPHTGKLVPFKAGEPDVKLDESALKRLAAGKAYSTKIESDAGFRGISVQDVEAPTDVVWGQILDFDTYNQKAPSTSESEIYKTEDLRDDGQKRIWARIKVGIPGLRLQYHVNHLYEPKENSLTWTLDYSKKSDFDDSAGFWYVIQHPDRPNHTRLFYSLEVRVFPWVPQFAVNLMSKQILTGTCIKLSTHVSIFARCCILYACWYSIRKAQESRQTSLTANRK
jgi:hypothetical protein